MWPMILLISTKGLNYRLSRLSIYWKSESCRKFIFSNITSLLRHDKRLGYCADDVPTVADLLNTADNLPSGLLLKTEVGIH